jgi:hypothetical protein
MAGCCCFVTLGNKTDSLVEVKHFGFGILHPLFFCTRHFPQGLKGIKGRVGKQTDDLHLSYESYVMARTSHVKGST